MENESIEREQIGKELKRLVGKSKGLCQFQKEDGFICCKPSINKFDLRCKEHHKMQVTTLSGRRIDAPPQINIDTNRKTIISLKNQRKWLLEQAYTEAYIKKDEFNLNWIRAENVNTLTPAVIDSLYVYLFGIADPVWDAKTGELVSETI
jgi:hypothetical protein